MSDLAINILKHRENFLVNLEESGWNCLIPFVNSSLFDDIVVNLYNQYIEGNRFTPKLKDTVNAFKECPYEDMKVVFVGQDPYPQENVADGISFSCSYTGKEQPSLRYIFDELEKTVYKYKFPPEPTDPKSREDYNPDLRRWANQGVLMFNTAMTVQIGKIGSHYIIWEKFTKFLFDELNKRDDLIFVLLGKKAESWSKHLDNNIIFNVPHPASAAYKGGKWDSKDVFNKINEELNKQGKTLIKW